MDDKQTVNILPNTADNLAETGNIFTELNPTLIQESAPTGNQNKNSGFSAESIVLRKALAKKREVESLQGGARAHLYRPEDEFTWRPFYYFTHHVSSKEPSPFWDHVVERMKTSHKLFVDGVLFPDGEFAFSDDSPQHGALSEAVGKEEVGRLQIAKFKPGYPPVIQVFADNKQELDQIASYLQRNISHPEEVQVKLDTWNDAPTDFPSDRPTISKNVYTGKLNNYSPKIEYKKVA
ncbi:MAG: hypothetical protein HY428_00660 [Candidatus Levybacteria bacterium]|nr:hypothetical protein [Candidatus Levybacteria bacterium]